MVNKLEFIGHIQKRVGSNLIKLTQQNPAIKGKGEGRRMKKVINTEILWNGNSKWTQHKHNANENVHCCGSVPLCSMNMVLRTWPTGTNIVQKMPTPEKHY